MVKIKPIAPQDNVTEFLDIEQAPPTSPPAPTTFEVQLARSRVAVFSYPTSLILQTAEEAAGILQADNYTPDFYRQVARLCCEKWGDHQGMPSSDRIRGSDDQQVALKFLDLFTEAATAAADVDSYSTLHEGEGKNGLDRIEIILTDGTILLLDEPTQEDMKRYEQHTHTVEGNVVMASSLCRKWGKQAIGNSDRDLTLAEVRLKMNRFSIEDHYRVTKALTFFRV